MAGIFYSGRTVIHRYRIKSRLRRALHNTGYTPGEAVGSMSFEDVVEYYHGTAAGYGAQKCQRYDFGRHTELFSQRRYKMRYQVKRSRSLEYSHRCYQSYQGRKNIYQVHGGHQEVFAVGR